MYSICDWLRIQIAVTTLRPNLQSANISYSMQKRLLFKIDYVCKIPWGGGRVIFGRQSNLVLMHITSNKYDGQRTQIALYFDR